MYNAQEQMVNGVKHLITLHDGCTTLDKMVNGVKHLITLHDECTTQEW